MSNQIQRRAYINTTSSAGNPTKINFDASEVERATVWFNVHCNPSYVLFLKSGMTLYCVDNYGVMNGLKDIWAETVTRKKDLFV
jgi:hypothetical protein